MDERQPRIAVIGASDNRSRYSNKAIRAWQARGYEVVPIHPAKAEIEGLKAYPNVADVPGEIDEATLYVRPSIGIQALEDLKRKGVRKVYANPGAESDELVEKAESLGLETIVACSILAAGSRPDEL
jgi:predicted CoA-binding protein